MNGDEPGRIARLAHDKHGRPVPWFVAWINGAPDFRIIRRGATAEALTLGCCWVCGTQFQRQEHRAFVVGPMCVVNLNTSEPPCHCECAVYSATHCPFLTVPNMVRRDRHLPPGTADPAGIFLRRNPGVTAVAVLKYNGWNRRKDVPGLIRMGEPRWVEWYAHGRAATRVEVLDAISSGLGAVAELAEREGPAAVSQLVRQHEAALRLVPR